MEDILTQPQYCPFCGITLVNPVLEAVRMTAYVDDHSNQSLGVSAYRCVEGHIFFVSMKDVKRLHEKIAGGVRAAASV